MLVLFHGVSLESLKTLDHGKNTLVNFVLNDSNVNLNNTFDSQSDSFDSQSDSFDSDSYMDI